MALKELECLTRELEGITQSLKAETRPQNRIELIERFSEILKIIKIKFGSNPESPNLKEAG